MTCGAGADVLSVPRIRFGNNGDYQGIRNRGVILFKIKYSTFVKTQRPTGNLNSIRVRGFDLFALSRAFTLAPLYHLHLRVVDVEPDREVTAVLPT